MNRVAFRHDARLRNENTPRVPYRHHSQSVACCTVTNCDADNETAPILEAISDPIATARRRHGAAGAMLAAGMFGIDVALGRKVKEEAAVVIAASDLPVDIDTDGIKIPIDEHSSVFAPPQPAPEPQRSRGRRRKS